MIRYFKEISSNFIFEWNLGIKQLFCRFSPELWGISKRNPHRFLKLRKESQTITRRRFFELMSKPENARLFQQVHTEYDKYMNPKSTFVWEHYPELKDKTVAYFSMEFGVDILRTYSGGLGILSGDHIRGASDMGIKMVGVGLFYFHGYYKQLVDSRGRMLVRYRTAAPSGRPLRDYLPLEPVTKKGTRRNLIVSVKIENREVYAKVWKALVGRTELLLLDTNTPENNFDDRNITYRLYQAEKAHESERRRRLEQEIVLGIGGVQALKEGGYEPAVYHLNEGHVAFAALEVIHELMHKRDLSFWEAREEAAKIIGFTTHTPVPEGNERFNEGMVRFYLGAYLDSFLGHDAKEMVFNCARNHKDEFDMTKLSLLLSGVCRNGVSKLHGEVCRKMWAYAWGIPEHSHHKVPITSITNSIHIPYWQSPEFQYIVEQAGGFEKITSASDEEIWRAHEMRKRKMVGKILEREGDRFYREKIPWLEIPHAAEKFHAEIDNLLSPESFIIGYARRFAGYKRAGFLLEDEEMFFSFLEESYKKYGKPIAVVYSGKPHPSSSEGAAMINYIQEVAKRLKTRCAQRGFDGRLLFVEGYNIELARRLVSGCDIWLNNPVRPLEASGTSGMKAAINGVLNLSISDGWVPEGIRQGKNGWMFGEGEIATEKKDRQELYKLLREEILPRYFERPGGLFYSPKWVAMMKASIRDGMQHFNMNRMLTEYIDKMYLPAVRSGHKRSS